MAENERERRQRADEEHAQDEQELYERTTGRSTGRGGSGSNAVSTRAFLNALTAR